MRKIFTLFSVITVITSQAQNNSQAFDWAVNPGSANNTIWSVRYDSQGNALALFQFMDSASFMGTVLSQPPSGSYPQSNSFVARRNTNNTGEVVLTRGNSSSDIFTSFRNMALDQNDNIFIYGSTSDPSGKNFGNGVSVSGKGYFFVKYNSAGTAQWAKQYNFGNPSISSFYTGPANMSLLADGSMVGLLIASSGKFALVKIDANGNELWYKEYITSATTAAVYSSSTGFFTDTLGRAYLYYNGVNATSYTLNGTTTNISNGTHPACTYILAFDENGDNRYVKGYRAVISDLAVEPVTGNVIFNVTQLPNQNNPAPLDSANASITSYIGVMITDDSLNHIKHSSSNLTELVSLEKLYPLGNSKVIGTKRFEDATTYTAGNQTYSLPNTSAFMWMELDSALVPSYFVAHPEINDNDAEPESVLAVYDNKVLVAAAWSRNTNPAITVNGTVLTANGNNTSFATHYNAPYNVYGPDVIFAQFDRTLQGGTTGIKENRETSVTLYPNPANTTLNIEVKESMNITIVNMLGATVATQKLNMGNNSIDVNTLPRGVYFLQTDKGGAVKFVKE